MDTTLGLYLLGAGGAAALLRALQIRLRLSRAKHPSLRGHARMARRIAKLVPFYSYDERRFFASDDAPDEVSELRRAGFERLRDLFYERSSHSSRFLARVEGSVSDAQFVSAYRVPFQYRDYVKNNLHSDRLSTSRPAPG